MSETIRTTRTTLDLHRESVVASLRKLLEADSHDWQAKNQLRLVSIASGLCEQVEFGVSAAHRLGILVTSGAYLDEILYSFLGRGEVREVRMLICDVAKHRDQPCWRIAGKVHSYP